jgi:thioredoxin 1
MIVTGALLLVAAGGFVGGCADGSNVVQLADAAQFQPEVLSAEKPVLVAFYKDGCASCAALVPTINKLSVEYKDRVKVVSYPLMTFVFIPRSPELRDRYDVVLYPTVLLIINGQERKRWVADYSINHYRQELDKVAPQAPPEKP